MLFPELERYKRQSPQLAELLTRLERYFAEILDRRVGRAYDPTNAAFDIVPVLTAQALGIDENLALVLLRIAEEAGVIVHRYDVFCPTIQHVIESFESVEDLPEHITCPYEARTEHSISEYFVELVFNFSPAFVREHKVAISV